MALLTGLARHLHDNPLAVTSSEFAHQPIDSGLRFGWKLSEVQPAHKRSETAD
jgi:hypothetical protein